MTTITPAAGTLPTTGLDSLIAGLLGGAGAAPTGLEGLFGALVGTATDGTQVASDPAALLAAALGKIQRGTATADATLGTDALPLVQSFDLGQGVKIELQGTGVDISALEQRITDLKDSLNKAGIDLAHLGTAEELTKALIVQGMDPKEAAAKATALESMLAVLKQKLDLKDGEETGVMALMLLAGAAQPLPVQQAVTITIRHDDQSLTMVNKNLVNNAVKGAYGDTNGDMLGRLLGRVKEDKKPGSDKVAEILTKVENSAAAQAVAPVAADTTPVPATPHITNEVPVAAVDVQAAVQAVGASKRNVSDVSKEDVLEPIEAETLYKLREGRDGALTVDATPAAGKVLEQQLNAAQTGEQVIVRHANKEGAGVPVQSAWPFADNVAAAAKARVGEQTVVQMKGLIGEGGGTVRMMLNPPELGEVHIELTIRRGEVTGTIASSDVAVVHELSRDLTGLKQAFADAGLKLGQDGLNVALSQQNNQGFGQQQSQQAQQGNAHGMRGGTDTGAATGEDGKPVASVSATRWVSPDSLVDVEI